MNAELNIQKGQVRKAKPLIYIVLLWHMHNINYIVHCYYYELMFLGLNQICVTNPNLTYCNYDSALKFESVMSLIQLTVVTNCKPIFTGIELLMVFAL